MQESEYPLLQKFAANEEEEMPMSRQLAAIGGEAGAAGGATLGVLNGLNGGTSRFRQRNKYLPGKERARLAAIQGVLGAVTGNAIGFTHGGGIGSLFDAHTLRKQDKEQRYQEFKEGVKEDMEYDLENRASSSEETAIGLYKTADFIRNIGLALGGQERKAKKAHDLLNNMDTFSSMPPNEYFPKMKDAEMNLLIAQAERDRAKKKLIAPGLAVGGIGVLAGATALDQKSMNARLREELAQESEGSGIDSVKRQGAGSVSHAPAGADKTAAVTPLFNPLEKTAGPLNFAKNFFGSNVRKAENRLKEIKNVPADIQERYNYTKDAAKGLRNAKKDRNRARLGAGVGLTAGGAALGGYGSYRSSQSSQAAQPDAGLNNPYYEEQKIAYESIMSRLEKSAFLY